MGCLRRIFVQVGCLVVLVALAVLGFIYREQLAAVYRRLRREPPPPERAAFAAPERGGADTARAALEHLARPGGPAYVDLTAGQVAALIEARLAGRQHVVDSLEVALLTGAARVRAVADLAQLPRNALGPFGGALDRREPVALDGTFAADSAGRVWWTVTGLTIGDFPFPRGTIGAVLKALDVPGLADRAVPLPLEHPVGDVTVRAGRLRLYRYRP